MTTTLLIIDPQNDFCDLPDAALPVPGACRDLERLAALIARDPARFDEIHVTLDSHSPFDIAHPAWWRDADGQPPAPFTPVTAEDVRNGRWQARDPDHQAASLAYVEALAARGRHDLVIWPEHCLTGSHGHGIYPPLAAALFDWSRRMRRAPHIIIKGTHPGSEHYSAVGAEVPDPAHPETLPDPRWLARLDAAARIVIAGEALSHCVAATTRDLLRQLGSPRARDMTLLTDCMSPVPGFEAQGGQFLDDMHAHGMTQIRSTAY